jgi:hypothetical protein
MKYYKIEIMSIGEDEYVLISKGHHEPQAFKQAVWIAGYKYPLREPEHLWCRCIPFDGGTSYWIQPKQKPGMFPVTYCREAYGTDNWNTEDARSDFYAMFPALQKRFGVDQPSRFPDLQKRWGDE